MIGKATLLFLAAVGAGILLTSVVLRSFVGGRTPENQPAIHVPVLPGNDPKAEYVAPKDLTIKLNETDGRDFRLTGEVWLNGPAPKSRFPGDRPDGFDLYLREVDSLHRYEASSRLIRDKRRQLGGLAETRIVPVSTWSNLPLHQWIPFSLSASQAAIAYQFGPATSEIRGPVQMDGVNEIALVAGTKLRNVHLEVSGATPR